MPNITEKNKKNSKRKQTAPWARGTAPLFSPISEESAGQTQEQVFCNVSDNLIEVLDAKNRPFMRMPLNAVQEQKLPHRYVYVAIQNTKGQLFLQQICPNADGTSAKKTSRPQPNALSTKENFQWELPIHGPVRAEETAEETARRITQEYCPHATIVNIHHTAPLYFSHPCNAQCELYTATVSAFAQNALQNSATLVSSADIQCIKELFYDELSPALQECLVQNLLFV